MDTGFAGSNFMCFYLIFSLIWNIVDLQGSLSFRWCKYIFFLAAPHTLGNLSSPVPQLGIEPAPLQWKPGVLPTVPPGKSLDAFLICPSHTDLAHYCPNWLGVGLVRTALVGVRGTTLPRRLCTDRLVLRTNEGPKQRFFRDCEIRGGGTSGVFLLAAVWRPLLRLQDPKL